MEEPFAGNGQIKANYSSSSTSGLTPRSSSASIAEHGTHKELFHEEVSKSDKPWWSKPQFFVVEPVLFGTWDGVFTSCLINIFGVVLFLRTGWMVGNVGIGLAVLIVFITITVALLAALSAIGICERLQDVQTGGIYYLVSMVLGGKIGGTLGVMYAFGLSVVAALYCTGFAESVTEIVGWDSIWAVRGVAIGTLFLLLGINLAESGFIGYSKEAIRNNTGPSYQASQNFFTVFGVFFPTATGVMAGVNMSGDLRNPAKSIPLGTLSALGMSLMLYLMFVMVLGSTCWRYALQTDYMIAEKVSAVGVLWLMGVYMSSLSSCSTGLYGAPRVLQSLANQNAVPAIKFLGKGFGANKTPVLAICASGFIALCFIFVGQVNAISPIITCIFMLVYAVVDYSYFALAMTYDLRVKNMDRYKEKLKRESNHHSSKNYGGLSDRNHGTMTEFKQDLNQIMKYTSDQVTSNSEGEETATEAVKENSDTMKLKTGREYLQESFLLSEQSKNGSDGMEEITLFEPGIEGRPNAQANGVVKTDSSHDKTDNANNSNNVNEEVLLDEENLTMVDNNNEDMATDDKLGLIGAKKKKKRKKKKAGKSESASTTTDESSTERRTSESEHDEYIEILRQPNSWYKHMCNRWVSLFGVLVTIVVMFLIQWLYSLMNILAFTLIYVYISHANPGAHPGVANEFHFFNWIKESFQSCCRSTPLPQEHIVVTPPNTAPYSVIEEQLNSDNDDFADRGRYHQAAIGDYDFNGSESTLLK